MLGATMGVEMATYNKYLENTVARGARGIPCSLSCDGRRYQLDSNQTAVATPEVHASCHTSVRVMAYHI